MATKTEKGSQHILKQHSHFKKTNNRHTDVIMLTLSLLKVMNEVLEAKISINFVAW